MSGYSLISLIDMIEALGEDRCMEILSHFSCPLNPDVQRFLSSRSYAVEFAKQGISQTTLVFASYKKEQVLCGYFTIANKYIIVNPKSISNTLRRRIQKFSMPKAGDGNMVITAPLIAQLGKNFSNGYNALITGDELLKLALEKVQEAQRILGGKFVYLECEDLPCLVDFYSENGFVRFGKRMLDRDETADYADYTKQYLVQLLKYIK